LGKFESNSQLQTISSIALLDSENAARSVFGGFVGLGKNPSISWSSDKYATQYQRGALIYSKLNDTILNFNEPRDTIKKPNPDDLNNHPYLDARVKHANLNINQFLRALDDGQWDLFERIVENEALTLCALLLSSEVSTFLPSGKMIDWVKYLRDAREVIECPVTFTFDRELRLHLIYPPIAQKKVLKIIEESPLPYTSILHDSIGKGVRMLKNEVEK
jgi:diphosphomevalonate decarboxylase